MEYMQLNNGVSMPALGFGVFQIPDAAECERAVAEALDVGYRLIDTAAAYGNEEAVGRAVAASGIARDELFITTKLWISDAGDGPAYDAFRRSADRLGLDVVDMFLIHQPFGDVYGSWRAMERLLADGRVRAIGVSNFQPDRLVDLIVHNDVVPAVNQVETHPYFHQVEARRHMEERGVQIQAWAPFAEGKKGLFTDPVLASIGEAHGKTVAQVTLRWLLQTGVAAIPKSVRRERMQENFDVFDFELTQGEIEAIAGLDTGGSLFIDHRDPASVERLSTLRVS
ncbi:MAG: aldo/keto reductase [Actinomycetaceae bacterium]|nr:aldo/keto reductase [Actinomycetaceae bacterium]